MTSSISATPHRPEELHWRQERNEKRIRFFPIPQEPLCQATQAAGHHVHAQVVGFADYLPALDAATGAAALRYQEITYVQDSPCFARQGLAASCSTRTIAPAGLN
jgi:hypothetical protein